MSDDGIRERIGTAIGRALAAPIARISAARRARTFHPRGVLFHARVEAVLDSPFAALGRRLEGPAVARFSGALFKDDVQRFEVLGMALRFMDQAPTDAAAGAADQDLLLATIISPFTMPLSPFTTRSDDFLCNRYWAVSPFRVDGVGRMKFRVSPISSPARQPGRRDDKLRRAVEEGRADLILEARRTLTLRWEKLAMVRLIAVSAIDQEALRFDPFRDGRGIAPAGVVHAIRRDVYSASQRARPTRNQ